MSSCFIQERKKEAKVKEGGLIKVQGSDGPPGYNFKAILISTTDSEFYRSALWVKLVFMFQGIYTYLEDIFKITETDHSSFHNKSFN